MTSDVASRPAKADAQIRGNRLQKLTNLYIAVGWVERVVGHAPERM
jgi:hypothetical protein